MYCICLSWTFLLYYVQIDGAHIFRVCSLPILKHGRRGGPGNTKRNSGQTTGVQTEPPRTSPASLLLCWFSLLQRARDLLVCRGPWARLSSIWNVIFWLSLDYLVILFTELPNHVKSQYTRGERYCRADGVRPTTSYQQSKLDRKSDNSRDEQV